MLAVPMFRKGESMAYYLVRAHPKSEKLDELETKLAENAFMDMEPFGEALSRGLNNARRLEDGRAIWEEEDYCSPPLAMERAAVLDDYFDQIEVERVQAEEGWTLIRDLPRLFD
jgi:hypothetical protein